jgi:phospholipid-binding lipoprotein MlaA
VRTAVPILSLLLLSACATTGGLDARTTERDPLEGFNRGMWSVNMAADKALIRPVSSAYRTVTPKPARRGLSRILANLEEPWSFVNNVLQGKPRRAARNLGRFVVNTTIGVGGLADHASGLGIPDSQEDFGQTLAVWGVDSGPYLVLPLFGPSTLRDGVGSTAALFADPWRVCLDRCTNLSSLAKLGLSGAEVVILRADVTESGADTFLATSLDPYAAARSAYYQSRRLTIRDSDGAPAPDDAAGASDADLDAAIADLKDQAEPDDATEKTPTTPEGSPPPEAPQDKE